MNLEGTGQGLYDNGIMKEFKDPKQDRKAQVYTQLGRISGK